MMRKDWLKRRRFIGLLGGGTSLLLFSSVYNPATEKKQPNIILFLADDLGYGDLACYNKDGLRTPAIESIAEQGVKFTSFYSNGPESSPTRTALLTGRYQQCVGGLECAIGTGNVGRYDEAILLREQNNLGLPVGEITIAKMLKGVGYNTAICGKWHLGYEEKFHPGHHGFDQSFCILGGDMDYFHHVELSPVPHLLFKNGRPVSSDGYITDLIGDESVKFIDKQSRKKPFFLYVPFTAPHAPYQGPDDHLPAPLSSDSPLWNQGKGPKPVYQAMITRMDENIDRICRKLAEKGFSENTIVIFMSDNGGSASGDNRPLNGFKGNLFEGGIRVACVAKWTGKIPAGILSDQPCISFDFTKSIAVAAGVPIPDSRPLDGIDILKMISEKRQVESRTLFWRSKRGTNVRKAVRDGDWKYICLSSNGKSEQFLFNLTDDLSEKNNLISGNPAMLKKLMTELDAWEKDVDANRLKMPDR